MAGNESSQGVQYYTDDITALPVRVIWRSSRKESIWLRLIALPYIFARKLFKRRFPATYGVARVSVFPPVAEAGIPEVALQEFAPYAKACRSRQMEHVQYLRSPAIGGKVLITSVWLDSAHTTYAGIAWMEMRYGEIRKTNVNFACHSVIQSGTELHTAPLAPTDRHPELVPPGHQPLWLPLDTSPAEAIDRHLARIAEHSDLRSFDEDSVMHEIVQATLQVFDYWIERGFYSPLTQAETERLLKASKPPVRNG